LKEPHRRAYLRDLQAEAEIAQRGICRLESRMKDLYDHYQMAGSDRVEKRLRVLTIISAITLPLALISGIFGMNVGGLPATEFRHGFVVVMGVMAIVAAAELWYFLRHRWFD
jgi:Mg2+ and Co2+ transporter CorA